MSSVRRVLFVALLAGVFTAGLFASRYMPCQNAQAMQTFTIPPGADGLAAMGTVEIVAVQDHLHMKRIIFRAKTPNDTARRAIEVVMENQGYTYWNNKPNLDQILEVDGWVYFWGIFVSK